MCFPLWNLSMPLSEDFLYRPAVWERPEEGVVTATHKGKMRSPQGCIPPRRSPGPSTVLDTQPEVWLPWVPLGPQHQARGRAARHEAEE